MDFFYSVSSSSRSAVLICAIVFDSATPWTVAHQAPLSIELSRQEYWSRLPFPTPGNLSNPGLNLCLLHWQADSLPRCHLRKCYWSRPRINSHLCWKLDRSRQYLAISKRLDEGFPGGSDSKESTHNAGDLGLIPRLGRSPGEGNGNLLQYSCLENSRNRGAWKATVREVAELDTTEWITYT